MSYRFMRILVMFDLPTLTATERSEYTRFRKYLIKERKLGLEIELKENIVSVVIIENVSLRSSIIKEIYSQSAGEKDGKWLLVENEN